MIMLMEFTNSVDCVAPGLLTELAMELNFPLMDLVLGLGMHVGPMRPQVIG